MSARDTKPDSLIAGGSVRSYVINEIVRNQIVGCRTASGRPEPKPNCREQQLVDDIVDNVVRYRVVIRRERTRGHAPRFVADRDTHAVSSRACLRIETADKLDRISRYDRARVGLHVDTGLVDLVGTKRGWADD